MREACGESPLWLATVDNGGPGPHVLAMFEKPEWVLCSHMRNLIFA